MCSWTSITRFSVRLSLTHTRSHSPTTLTSESITNTSIIEVLMLSISKLIMSVSPSFVSPLVTWLTAFIADVLMIVPLSPNSPHCSLYYLPMANNRAKQIAKHIKHPHSQQLAAQPQPHTHQHPCEHRCDYGLIRVRSTVVMAFSRSSLLSHDTILHSLFVCRQKYGDEVKAGATLHDFRQGMCVPPTAIYYRPPFTSFLPTFLRPPVRLSIYFIGYEKFISALVFLATSSAAARSTLSEPDVARGLLTCDYIARLYFYSPHVLTLR
jgi:hypothetical protein